MKIALVTTPFSSRSGIADYTRHLLPYLREGAAVDLFVEAGREDEESCGETLRSVADLAPRAYDQILYQLGNEAQHAFMARLVRALGGTVVLHDWVLFDLAVAAYPVLAQGGPLGLRKAWQEGGAGEARAWRRYRRGGGASGWYALEAGGRWSAAKAEFACAGAEALEIDLHLPSGRSWELLQGQSVLASGTSSGDSTCRFELETSSLDVPRLRVRGAGPVGGDARELGLFLRSARARRAGDWSPLALDDLASAGETGLSAGRFELSFNRSIVRHGDAFLVHSDEVGERILESRNAPTPIFRIHHGVERRWSDEPRARARTELGLAPEGFLVATFGALQPHKRPGMMLDALARLRGGGVPAQLLCVGEERPAEYDLRSALAARGLGDAVHVTGWLPEERAWRALHAADVCVNLRGPSTLGTSGGASQALSVGRPVIVSDLPEVAHLPGACVLRVGHGVDEAGALAAQLETLARDEGKRRALEIEARRVVDEELHWSQVAQRTLELLEEYPHARSARRSFAVRLMQAAATQRAAATPSESP